MSIAKLTTPYTNPYVVSLDDVDLIKIRSLEASPLTHEDLDDNFANLAYKVNELVDIIGGSSSVITADANGKVGIGTATPELAFHVKSSSIDGTAIFENADEGDSAAPDLILRRSSASPADEDYLGHLRWQGRKIGQDGIHSTVDYADIYGRIAVAGEAGSDGGAGKLVFRTRQDTGSHNFMVFDEVGNLGIGTRTPVKPLEIQFTDNTAYAGSGTGNALRVRNISEAADTFSSLEMFAGQTSEGNANIARIFAVKESTTSTATSLAFTTRGSSVISEKMRIDSDGNVGIGTTDPSDELTISATSPAIRLVDESDSSHGTVGYNASFLSLNADGGQDAINSGIQFNVDSSEKMRIDSDGNVGIGTDSPTAPLHVVGKFANNGYGVFTASTSAPGVYVNKTDADLTQSTDYIHFRNTGQFSGEISYDGTDVVISQTSDARLKENIKDSGSGLNIVNNLQIRSFDWVGEKRKSKRFGFIAQEMHKVFKEAVKVGGEDENEEPWAISDSKLIPVLTKAIQEQQQIIDQLKSQNESQQSTINDLASRIETLENK